MKSDPYWKPTSEDFITNPAPYYDELRAFGPVFKAVTGEYVIIGYDECKQVLRDPTCHVGNQKERLRKIISYAHDKGESLGAIEEMIDGMPIQMNEPTHTMIRSILSKSWPNQNLINALATESCHRFIGELPQSFEAVQALCKKIPLYVITSLLGFPFEQSSHFAADGLKVVQALDPYFSHRDLHAIQKASERLSQFILKTITAPNYQPTPLAHAFLEIERSNPEVKASSLFAFLFIAGFETTTTLLATCLHVLITQPGFVDQLKTRDTRLFVKEILRVHSPVQITGRITTQPLHLGGMDIPENSALTVCLGAANMDPTHFEDAHTIDLDRPRFDHLSFGFGFHHCLGSQLAETEAQVFIESILPQIHKFQLVEVPVYEKKFAVKSFKSMKIAIDG